VLRGVGEVELVRANHVALGADAEQLAFDGVQVDLGVDRLGEDLVERQLSRSRGALRSTGVSL